MNKKVECYICGKTGLTRNEIGLNKKIIGVKVTKYHCLQCLAEHLEIPVEELEERIQDFKESGCLLFE